MVLLFDMPSITKGKQIETNKIKCIINMNNTNETTQNAYKEFFKGTKFLTEASQQKRFNWTNRPKRFHAFWSPNQNSELSSSVGSRFSSCQYFFFALNRQEILSSFSFGCNLQLVTFIRWKSYLVLITGIYDYPFTIPEQNDTPDIRSITILRGLIIHLIFRQLFPIKYDTSR